MTERERDEGKGKSTRWRGPVVIYDTHQLATVSVPDGYAGTVVLWKIPTPKDIPPPHGWGPPWFKRMLIVKAGAGAVAFVPADEDVVFVDFVEGFDPTPENLHLYVRRYWDERKGGGPIPPGPPVVT